MAKEEPCLPFNPKIGIRILETAEVKNKASSVVREKLLSNTDMVDDGHKYLTDGNIEIYPAVMTELLSNPVLLARLERRLNTLKLNDLITFLNCGEDTVVFALGNRYVLRIAKAYNRAFNLDSDDIPSPMLRVQTHSLNPEA